VFHLGRLNQWHTLCMAVLGMMTSYNTLLTRDNSVLCTEIYIIDHNPVQPQNTIERLLMFHYKPLCAGPFSVTYIDQEVSCAKTRRTPFHFVPAQLARCDLCRKTALEPSSHRIGCPIKTIWTCSVFIILRAQEPLKPGG
jgi:hypothetical protein